MFVSFVFFFKQNTAYEMRISDWSSDVCSSDLHAGSANLRAAAMGRIGEFDEALALYSQVLERFPDQAKVWMPYGHVLKTVGRQAEGIEAYRRARPEERRVGNEGVRTCRFRWSPYE